MTGAARTADWVRGGLLWLLPPAVLLAVYWKGLWVWFHGDDFTLLTHVSAPGHEFWDQIWRPRAQGTYRTLSERLFFRYFHSWFGLNALPFRVWAFATQIVNLWLLGAVLRRAGMPRGTAAAAACLWAAHNGLSGPMSWSSSYNQILFSFFLLTSLLGWQEFVRAGKLGYYAAQWATFLVGFLALEAIVVYPALALAYAVLVAGRRWAWALPMFAGSAAMAWVQLRASPPGAAEGAYRMSFSPLDWLRTLRFYVELAFGGLGPAWPAWAAALALAAFVAWDLRRGRRLAAFGALWFVITLAPYLPLGGHLTDYYLFAPAAGLATAAACTLAAAWRGGWAWRGTAALLLAPYLSGTLAYGASIVDYSYRTSIRARNLVTGLRFARARHPNRTILLTGLDETFFYAAVYHDVFRLAGVYDVYLAPDANNVRQRPDRAPIDRFLMPPDDALRATLRGTVAVYDASGMRLRNRTSHYRRLAPARLEALVSAGRQAPR